MAWFTRSSHFAILAVALLLGSAVNASAQMLSQSGSPTLGSMLESAFRAPRRIGAPDNRQGGATRGPCFVDARPLAAIAPLAGGDTAAEYPTVFWYMPKMTAKDAPAPEIQFTLRDANDNKIYSANYPLQKSAGDVVAVPGIMSLTVAKPYGLEVGKQYTWQLKVTCNSQSSDNSESQTAEGGLKRVAADPNLALRLQQVTPEERIAIYAQANLWYEMLANLVRLRRDRPNDANLTDAWEKLLAVVDLDAISQKPKLQGARTSNTYNP
jgi:hypothetical protein